MQAWRLSIGRYADRLDGGFGLVQAGRWNSIGRRVTYAATTPSLCVLERLVHLDLAVAMPDDLVMTEIDLPDEGGIRRIEPSALPGQWVSDEAVSRSIGDAWHASGETLTLSVPSAVLPMERVADRNLVISHEHPAARRLLIVRSEPFRLDQRLRPDLG
jgi:RES domain-containing protein